MPLSVWLGLGFLILVVLAGLATLAMRTLAAWRSFRRLHRQLTELLGRLTAAADLTQSRVETVSGGSERLQKRVARLTAAIAQLRLILDEARAVLAPFARIRSAYARK